jgi:hypothetical protein
LSLLAVRVTDLPAVPHFCVAHILAREKRKEAGKICTAGWELHARIRHRLAYHYLLLTDLLYYF